MDIGKDMIQQDFDRWLAKVNDAVFGYLALRPEWRQSDLPDIAYWDLFESGYTPGEAAQEALAEAGWLS